MLHQVSASFSGRVDSTQVGTDGTFQISLPRPPAADGDDLYFASTRFDSILYFGNAVTSTSQLDSTYLIQVYPTAVPQPGVTLPLRIRNLFLEKPDVGIGGSANPGWLVTDLFELRNRSETTLVAGEGPDDWIPTWSHALPPGLTDFEVGQGDLPPDGAMLDRGRVLTTAPLLPGETVYLFRYRLPTTAMTIPLEAATASVELLIREPGGELSVTGLAAADPIELDGRTFRRFAGRDLSPGQVTIQPGRPFTPGRAIKWLSVVLAATLALVGALLTLRSDGLHANRSLGGDVARVPRATLGNNAGKRSTGRRSAKHPPAKDASLGTHSGPGPTSPAQARRLALVEIARLDEAHLSGEIAEEEYRQRRAIILSEMRQSPLQ